jgi:hypothetical protein
MRYIEYMSLAAAIDEVYSVFADVEKPSFVDGCQCCMTADQYEALTKKPLRELTAGELSQYAGAVMRTMGSGDEYPYFLPRILELEIEEGPDWLNSIEITGDKLRMAGFARWSEERQNAVKDLWLSFIRARSSPEEDTELIDFRSAAIDSWLAAATLVPIPVSPLLTALEAAPEIIREIYNYNFTTLFQGRLNNAFLKEPSEAQAEIAHWLRDRINQ